VFAKLSKKLQQKYFFIGNDGNLKLKIMKLGI
jgi:hypothetical protein